MSRWVQMGCGYALVCLGAVACGGGDDPETPHGGPPGSRLTIPDEAFGGSSSSGGSYNYAGAPVGTAGTIVGGTGGLLVSGTGGSPGTGGTALSSGGASPVAYCTGVATPCSLLGNSQCASARGCDIVGSCEGFSEFCSSQFYSSSCYGVKGCYWSSSSEYCSGSSWTCDLFSGSASCVGQPGCHWDETCDGIVTPCSLLSEIECGSQPGCRLDYR